MRSFTALLLAGLLTVVNAHFQLQFPPPRGAFVEDQETGFCDGYTSVAANRTQFPLNNGILTLNSEHPKWTATILLTNASNPTSFDNFSQILPFFSATIEGSFCMPLDLSQTNATGLQDGSNVTLQVLYAADDGNLFQCSDLTLSSNASVSSVSCTNSTSSSSSALSLSIPSVSPLLGLAGLAFALL